MFSVRSDLNDDRMIQAITGQGGAHGLLSRDRAAGGVPRPGVATMQQIASHVAFIERKRRDGESESIPLRLIQAERDRLITNGGCSSRVDDRGDEWLVCDGADIAYLGHVGVTHHESGSTRARPRARSTGWRSWLIRSFRLTA